MSSKHPVDASYGILLVLKGPYYIVQNNKILFFMACFSHLKRCLVFFVYQVKLSEKLSHVQSLCIHEMIVRAFKHILQAVIAAVVDPEKLAMSIAAALNLMLGVPGNGELNHSCNAHPLVWRWLEVFTKKRYEWDFSTLNYKDVRKFAVLRGVCHKVF